MKSLEYANLVREMDRLQFDKDEIAWRRFADSLHKLMRLRENMIVVRAILERRLIGRDKEVLALIDDALSLSKPNLRGPTGEAAFVQNLEKDVASLGR